MYKTRAMNRFISTLCTSLPLTLLASTALAQMPINVDLSKPVNVLTSQLIGAYAQQGDGDLLDPQSLARMRAAGLTTISYPTGWDSMSSVYHWSTNSITPKAGNASAPKAPYVNPGNDFGHVAMALQKVGITTLVHVNYGSSLKGGGGEPKEAAAWVAYANGSASDTHTIGADSTGQDWKDTAFWATLRGSAPIAPDDGYNFLRINHPDPFHVMLWEVGEDEANNGFYGGDHKGTLDMHAAYPASANDNEKRRKAHELSPTFYGEQTAAYIAAMKAVDPSIKIGASLTTPTVDTFASDWNTSVLKAACKDLDFVAFSWHPGNAQAPDYKTLDDSSVLSAPAAQLPQILSEYLDETKHACPAGKTPRVVFSDFSPIPWAKMQEPVVPALFAAETFAILAESGTSAANWSQLRDGGLLDKDKPLPPYYGIQMLHIVAFRPGDAFVTTTGAKGSLVAFATKRADGVAGVLLENQDPKQTQQVRLNITGADLAGTGVRFDYGRAQLAKSSGPEKSDVKTDGNSITVSVPPYGIVDLLLALKK
jgi:hypothetical protein